MSTFKYCGDLATGNVSVSLGNETSDLKPYFEVRSFSDAEKPFSWGPLAPLTQSSQLAVAMVKDYLDRIHPKDPSNLDDTIIFYEPIRMVIVSKLQAVFEVTDDQIAEAMKKIEEDGVIQAPARVRRP